MERCALSFLLGAILALFMPLVPVIFCEIILIQAIFVFLFRRKFNAVCSTVVVSVITLLAACAIGFCWLQIAANDIKSQTRQPELAYFLSANKAFVADVIVDSIPKKQQQAGKVTFQFFATINSIQGKALSSSVKVLLNWQQPLESKLLSESKLNEPKAREPKLKEPKLNDKWQLLIKAKPSRGFGNIGSVNYQRSLWSKQISLTGYVKPDVNNSKLIAGNSLRQQWFDGFTQLTATKLTPTNVEAKSQITPLIAALVFGERIEFTEQHWQTLTNTGTLHLMAISGLHIGLAAIFAYALFSFVFKLLTYVVFLANNGFSKNVQTRLAAKLTNKLTNTNLQQLKWLLALISALGYAWLAGFSTPTIRAFVFLSLFVACRSLFVYWSFVRIILVTLGLMILLFPLSLLQESFWLTFIAVLVICFTSWQWRHHFSLTENSSKWWKVWRYVKNLVLLQFAFVVLLMPVNMLIFQQFSPMALAANLVAVPLVSLHILPLLLFSFLLFLLIPDLAASVLLIAEILLTQLWHFLSLLSLNTQVITNVSNSNLALCLGVLLLIGLFNLSPRLTVKSKPMLMVFGVISFSLLGMAMRPVPSEISHNSWQVNVLDVGQGLAVVILKNQQVFVYDTGASFFNGGSAAERVLLPFLQANNIDKIEQLVISHSDNDHAGGINYLLQHMPIEAVIYNNLAFPNAHTCIKGESWHWQHLTIQALSPTHKVAKGNASSCVLTISDGSHRLLLSGDIDRKTELAIVKGSKPKSFANIKSDILIAPHHGSKTSSSRTFINAVQPKFTVFSAGFNNRWRMPQASIVERYIRTGSQVFTTGELGMVRFNISTQGIETQNYRQDINPYWFNN